MEIKIENLTKIYGRSTVAVDDISFTAEEGELTSLVGPSGCGKTTTLRSIAGLERPNQGRISIGDEVVTDPADNVFVPPQDRDIGFVFQTFDVWPHLSVFENVAYPLRNRDIPEDEIEERVKETLELTGIGELADKQATQLSGGQQARVGISRAIVYEPKVLLFDEPLTGLDRNLRQRMRYEIKRIQSEVGITSVYVTHNQPEAMTLSDKILLMNTNGKIEQMGTPQEIYNEPRTQFTFDFFGSSVELTGTTTDTDKFETDLGEVESIRGQDLPANENVTLGFRARDVEVSSDGINNGDVNQWSGRVEDINFLGEMFEILVMVQGKSIQSRAPSLPTGMAEGQTVSVHVDPEDVFVYHSQEQTPLMEAEA